METGLRGLWVLITLFALRVSAQCVSYGVDYSNGRTYNIDGSSNQYFSFSSVFQGCNQETISPVLVGPDGSEYACSVIRTQPEGQQVTSTCGIPFSAMRSGTWRIIVAGNQIASQRTIQLIVGQPQTTWVTVTPTVVVGVTVTARASTVVQTLSQTQTLILVPRTITTPCQGGGTRTVTNYPQGPTVVVSSTVVRTATDGQVTSYYQTTVTATATCHYPTRSGSIPSSSVRDNPFPTPTNPGFCIGQQCGPGGGWGKGRGRRGDHVADSVRFVADNKRDVAATAAAAAVAAVTSTYTQTTYTVTQTLQTTIPGRTTTEIVLRTVTATITPAPSTVCAGGQGAPGVTVTVNIGNPTTVTQTNIVYRTTHLSGTAWVGQTFSTTYTNSASATACWRAGGWFG